MTPVHTSSELLLNLVQPVKTDQAVGRLNSLLEQSLDWDWLVNTAQEHRVLPVIYKRLSDFPDRVPTPVLTALQTRYKRSSEFNLGLTGKLLKLLTLLREHNIPAITYKGPALAQLVYGDISLRQFTDLDLLIHKSDIHRTKELLLANGCQPGWLLTQSQEKAVLRHYYAYPFLSNSRRVLIEVHWELSERFFAFDFAIEQIWQRADNIKLLGKTVQTLSLEDTLLFLCAHGSKHSWKRLGWICDVGMLISERRELDWELLTERATRLGLLRILWLGTILADEVFKLSLPAEIRSRITNESRLNQLARHRIKEIFSELQPQGTLRATLFQISVRERMRDRFNYCYRLLLETKLVDSLFMPMGRPR